MRGISWLADKLWLLKKKFAQWSYIVWNYTPEACNVDSLLWSWGIRHLWALIVTHYADINLHKGWTPQTITKLNFLTHYPPNINIYIIFPWRNSPYWARASSLSRLHDDTHLDTPHSVGLLWMSDHSNTETSTCQHTTLTRDRHHCSQRDLNLQYQQVSRCRQTP